MKNKPLLALCALVVSLACTITLFDTTPTPVPTATFTPTATATFPIPPADTGDLPTEPPVEPPTDEPSQPTRTPLPTLTPYPTPTIDFSTPTPQYEVTATLVKNANCRVGPSQDYEVYTSFFAGQVLEVVGRNPDFDNTWWMVVIPGTRATCWISFVTAQVTGNLDDLPIIYPPY
ncbi:MAG: SH3 domain-containing protein [Chloroflexota bacterium]